MAAHPAASRAGATYPIESVRFSASDVVVRGRTISMAYADRVETMLPDGRLVHAFPNNDEESSARAASLGYSDVLAMTLEHDPLHVLLCARPARVASAAAIAHRRVVALADAEEAMVLAAQRFLNLFRSEKT